MIDPRQQQLLRQRQQQQQQAADAAEPNEGNPAEESSPDEEQEGQGAPASSASSATSRRDAGGADDQPNVSPEEQDLYDKIVAAGMQIIYAKGAPQMLAQRFRAAGPDGVAAAIGQTAAMVLLSVYRTVHAQGVQADPELLLQAGQELLAEVMEVARAAGVIRKEDEDQLLPRAAMEAVKAFGESEMRAGLVTPEMRQQAQQVLAGNGVDPNALQQHADAYAQQSGGGAASAPQPQQPQSQPPRGGLTAMAGRM